MRRKIFLNKQTQKEKEKKKYIYIYIKVKTTNSYVVDKCRWEEKWRWKGREKETQYNENIAQKKLKSGNEKKILFIYRFNGCLRTLCFVLILILIPIEFWKEHLDN